MQITSADLVIIGAGATGVAAALLDWEQEVEDLLARKTRPSPSAHVIVL